MLGSPIRALTFACLIAWGAAVQAEVEIEDGGAVDCSHDVWLFIDATSSLKKVSGFRDESLEFPSDVKERLKQLLLQDTHNETKIFVWDASRLSRKTDLSESSEVEELIDGLTIESRGEAEDTRSFLGDSLEKISAHYTGVESENEDPVPLALVIFFSDYITGVGREEAEDIALAFANKIKKTANVFYIVFLRPLMKQDELLGIASDQTKPADFLNLLVDRAEAVMGDRVSHSAFKVLSSKSIEGDTRKIRTSVNRALKENKVTAYAYPDGNQFCQDALCSVALGNRGCAKRELRTTQKIGWNQSLHDIKLQTIPPSLGEVESISIPRGQTALVQFDHPMKGNSTLDIKDSLRAIKSEEIEVRWTLEGIFPRKEKRVDAILPVVNNLSLQEPERSRFSSDSLFSPGRLDVWVKGEIEVNTIRPQVVALCKGKYLLSVLPLHNQWVSEERNIGVGGEGVQSVDNSADANLNGYYLLSFQLPRSRIRSAATGLLKYTFPETSALLGKDFRLVFQTNASRQSLTVTPPGILWSPSSYLGVGLTTVVPWLLTFLVLIGIVLPRGLGKFFADIAAVLGAETGDLVNLAHDWESGSGSSSLVVRIVLSLISLPIPYVLTCVFANGQTIHGIIMAAISTFFFWALLALFWTRWRLVSRIRTEFQKHDSASLGNPDVAQKAVGLYRQVRSRAVIYLLVFSVAIGSLLALWASGSIMEILEIRKMPVVTEYFDPEIPGRNMDASVCSGSSVLQEK